MVTNVAREVLDGLSWRVFFRSMGRRCSMVGTTSLLVAIAAGLVLLWSSPLSSGTRTRHLLLAAPDAVSRSTQLLASRF
ncbi:MAG TPA: hypothetical protein VNF08_05915 [Acidimicrobiales bacterium]|nr:hypothetical protein [Acidimicrobiales bacterium]